MSMIALRVFGYMVLVVLLTEAMRLEARLLTREQMYSELGFVELTQALLVATMSIVLALNARREIILRQLSLCLSLGLAIILIRELDQVLELWLPHGSWKWIAAIPALVLARYYWTRRAQIGAQVVQMAQLPSFGLMTAGLLVLVFSRMFGRAIYWMPVMGEGYEPFFKAAIQEGTELIGYFVLAIGVFEFFHHCRNAPGRGEQSG